MDVLAKAKSFLKKLETHESPASGHWTPVLKLVNASSWSPLHLILFFPPLAMMTHPKTWTLWPRGNTFLPESAWSRERNQEPTSPRHPSSWAGRGQHFQRAPSSFLQLLCESSQLKLLPMDGVRAGLQITAPNSCWHVWGEAGTEHLVGNTGSITQSDDGKSSGMSPGHSNTTIDVSHTGSTQTQPFNQNSDNSTEVGRLRSGKR